MAATAAPPHSPPADYLAGDAEKGDLSPSTSAPSSITNAGGDALVTEKSRGVRQMEALQTRLSTKYRILLYGSFAVLAYVMSLGMSYALQALGKLPSAFSICAARPAACLFLVPTLMFSVLPICRPIHQLFLPDGRHFGFFQCPLHLDNHLVDQVGLPSRVATTGRQDRRRRRPYRGLRALRLLLCDRLYRCRVCPVCLRLRGRELDLRYRHHRSFPLAKYHHRRHFVHSQPSLLVHLPLHPRCESTSVVSSRS